MEIMMIIRNQIKTPDGTILRSLSHHHFVGTIDANGDYYFTDGGTEYIRRSMNKIPAEDQTLYHDSPFELVREVDWWITYGKYGDQPAKRIALRDMTYGHLKAILETQFHLPFEVLTLFEKEMAWRRNQ